ncbi:glycosyl hydrolase [Labilibacter marinus]|uniref:glycosyl hydrolase n=1 Tax=Labilibacter marinus TaxID=1477105 RepID=UPI0018E92966|nr:glycosyl hydrolase [Labilibacter marinus]
MPILQAENTSLEQNFQNPPPSARARVMWFWINGNVTKTGITADLEAMKDVGIQGALIFNASLGQPRGFVSYLSPEWLDLFNFAALEAQRLGLELSFHNGAGWSSSGSPVVTPEYAMQTVVYSETIYLGGQEFKGQLEQPETNLGYYKDIAVLAFPKPQSEERINDLDFKSLSGKVRNHLGPDDKSVPVSAVVKKSDIIDLTSQLSPDDSLKWNAPAGEWVILRLGHTPTGKKNIAAPNGGQGLECDKMSRKAVDVYWQGAIMPIVNKLDTLIGSVVKRCHIDSYEVGTTNWTSGFSSEFKRIRAYDCESFLPTLAGYYIESGEETERFLWDFRRSIGDLMAEHYYGYFGELCHQHGMQFSTEPYWGPFDNMQVGATADAVLSEFWSGHLAFFDSPKFVASIAKLNGSSIAEAEAFTDMGGWQQHPGALKAMGDLAWAQGINRFVFHCYVHQPWDVAPGLTLGPFGIDFNRLNTWWNQSKPFVDYVARGQYLLQQGTTVADVLVFAGEASPNDALLIPEIKALGYDYDLIGSNKINELTVNEGLVCTPLGDKYQALVLPSTSWMTPQTLETIDRLVNGGATILASKPEKSPSLNSYPSCDESVAQLADKLWSKGLIKENSIVEELQNGTLPPDFSIENGSNDAIDFIHRKSQDADIYFVVNSRKESRELGCRFRVSGLQPELWNAETGEIGKATVWQDNGDGTTTVTIPFASEASVFVLFREPVSSEKHILSTTQKLQKSAAKPLPNLEIIKAEYGTFLPSGLVDMTEVIKNKVQNNSLNVQATRSLCDCDPAPGYHKELRIEYKIGDIFLEKNAMEKEWLEITASDKGELEIMKAVFGKFEPGISGIPPNNPVYDVSDKVKSMLATGVYEIPVNDSFAEGKYISTKKALHLVYTTNGVEKYAHVPNGETLKLTQATIESKLIHKNGVNSWVTPYLGEMTYRSSAGKSKTIKVKSVPKPIELTGDWNVSFPAKEDESIDVIFSQLSSWSTSGNDAIRYFSGTATYKKQFELSSKFLKEDISLLLDLGSVKEIAEVFVNGKPLGILWKAPFRLNIDDYVQAGENTLEVRITNLWTNRLIGDEQMELDYKRKGPNVKQWPDWLLNNTERPTERSTFAAYKHWHKDSELLPSGLLGPVKIVVSRVIEI